MISHFPLSPRDATRLRFQKRSRTVRDAQPASRHSNFPGATDAAHSSADDRQHFPRYSPDHPDVDIFLYGAGRIGSSRSAFWEVFENGRTRSALQTPIRHRPSLGPADPPTVEA